MSNEFFVKFRLYDEVETNWTCSICFDFGNNGNNVEATFDFVERIVRLVAFDNVAGLKTNWLFQDKPAYDNAYTQNITLPFKNPVWLYHNISIS